MDTKPQSFEPVHPLDVAVDDLLASHENLIERPFDVDDGWHEVTREYDTRTLFGLRVEVPDDQRTTLQSLKDAQVGLDLFLSEASVALITGHRYLTSDQRTHLSKILTFIEALSSRLDRVMKQE